MTSKENKAWIKSINRLSCKEARSGINEMIYSLRHNFSEYERRILIKAGQALEINTRRLELIDYYDKQIEEYPYDVQGVSAYAALKKCEEGSDAKDE